MRPCALHARLPGVPGARPEGSQEQQQEALCVTPGCQLRGRSPNARYSARAAAQSAVAAGEAKAGQGAAGGAGGVVVLVLSLLEVLLELLELLVLASDEGAAAQAAGRQRQAINV